LSALIVEIAENYAPRQMTLSSTFTIESWIFCLAYRLRANFLRSNSHAGIRGKSDRHNALSSMMFSDLTENVMRVLIARAAIFVCFLSSGGLVGQSNSNQTPLPRTESVQATLLKPAEAADLLPATVFFQGKTAPVQGRNSGGIRFEDKSLMLISLIDTAGYSSQVQEKYQAYLITESPLDVDGHRLVPGAYGCGFLGDGSFIVMDIGGHDLFSARATHDGDLRRPTPLQIMTAPNEPGKYRLYAGRNFVRFWVATGN
jgi:hypothetical protein